MRINLKRTIILLLFFAVIFCITNCFGKTDYESETPLFSTYREIPGVTEQEIEAIEALKKNNTSFIYGMIPSTEAFINSSGEAGGYAALFCKWLTSLFGIPFQIQIFQSDELLEKLASGEIDFSGNMILTPERQKIYYMTDSIAERQFISIRLQGSPDLDYILNERPLKYAFSVNIPSERLVSSVTKPGIYEPVWVSNFQQAYDAMKNGEADAYITININEASADDYNDLIVENFYPLIFSSSTMAAANPALEPVISVVRKAQRNGIMPYLTNLYRKGYDEYRHKNFFMSLDEEEKIYLQKTVSVPLAVQYYNYPIVFYNTHEKKWDGITFDLLSEIERITGLTFNVVNKENTGMQDLMQMLSDGRAHIFSDLVHSDERDPYYIWSENEFFADQYALLSKTDTPNVHLNYVPYARVGLIKNSIHTDIFRIWFPNAKNTTEYDTVEDAFYALEHEDIDLLMSAKSKQLYYSNYHEYTGYKINFLFNYFYKSTFAFNKDQKYLRSIIDKALAIIDTTVIVEQWLTKTYDYRAKTLEARFPWLIGAIILTALVLATILIIFNIRNRQSIKLQKEHERTRIMLDTLPIACFMGTKDNKILDCNTETVRLFELKSKHDFIERFEKDLSPEFQPDGQRSLDAIRNYGVKTVNEGKCVFNWTHQMLDGTPIPSIVTLENVIYNKEDVIMAYIRDMREHSKMTSEINRQNELLKTVNNVTATLLEPNISNFENTLQKSMGIIAEVAGVDRICIWRNTSCYQQPGSQKTGDDSNIENKQLFSLGFQWEKSSFKTMTKEGELAPDICFANHPFWNEPMIQGNCLNSFVRDMPPDDQAELAQRNILSILMVPVFLHDCFWGVVGFDNCTKEQLVNDGEMLILRSASRMIANAVIRNEMADELVSAKEQAEKSNRSKSIFLSHMSHEIRTPMNAILGIAEIQLRDEGLSDNTLEAFNKIYESGDLLLNIINDLLDLSKIESGKLELSYIKYDIPSLINDTAQLNRLRYDSKPILFSIGIDENTPIDFLGDVLRIKQILNNILSNAFKYTDEGEIKFHVSTEPAEENPEENIILVFSVTDTGQGMTESQIEKLFEEYSRFNLEKNRTTVGAGLGMSITKRLIGLMNGSISVKSEPDKGSEFTVRIPQKYFGNAVCGPELSEKLRNFSFMSTTITKKTRFIREYMPYGSVLIVDDVESNIYVTKGMLHPYGLKIDTSNSGIEAIEKVKNGEVYDIIFMDHMMPKMDGIEATKKLRSMGYTNPIIALTANALVGRSEMFLRNGFDGFISKPIDSRELNQYLNDFIRNKQPPEVVEAAHKEQQEKNLLFSDLNMQEIAKSSEMTELFIVDAKNAINVLEEIYKKIQALDYADLELYITTVHGMKSALNNIGEKELSDIALKLEQAGEDRNQTILSNVTPVFLNSLHALIKKLKPAGKINVSEISETDMEYLREKFLEIQKACTEFNKNAAKNALNELKRETWPGNISSILDDISINILHSAFKKIVTTIENYFQSNSN